MNHLNRPEAHRDHTRAICNRKKIVRVGRIRRPPPRSRNTNNREYPRPRRQLRRNYSYSRSALEVQPNVSVSLGRTNAPRALSVTSTTRRLRVPNYNTRSSRESNYPGVAHAARRISYPRLTRNHGCAPTDRARNFRKAGKNPWIDPPQPPDRPRRVTRREAENPRVLRRDRAGVNR